MSDRLDPLLVELLVCPQDKQPLWYLADEPALINPRLRRRYAIDAGIPVLLIDEADDLDEAEFARLEAEFARAGVLTGSPVDTDKAVE